MFAQWDRNQINVVMVRVVTTKMVRVVNAVMIPTVNTQKYGLIQSGKQILSTHS